MGLYVDTCVTEYTCQIIMIAVINSFAFLFTVKKSAEDEITIIMSGNQPRLQTVDDKNIGLLNRLLEVCASSSACMLLRPII